MYAQVLKVSLALLLTAASSLAAQAAPGRTGFGMAFGLGSGSAGITCDDCQDADPVQGLSGFVRIGGYVTSRFFIGVEGTGWMKNDDDLERRIAAVSLTTMGYPSDAVGLHLRGGFGFMRAVVENSAAWIMGEGLTWQAGLGWDLPARGAVALTPYVNYIGSNAFNAILNDVPTGYTFSPNLLQFGLAITVH